ncbi:sugar phosphate nucleotidyltransferase [Aneurinibacillus aneurinilyticus]|uniref:sugar phosphate nucleotidyltransferase n=1 Tax=Aneurinibacillus aneurinilyticus TaxID=1391 RepID=UPI00366AB624
MKLILLSGGSGKRLWPLSNASRAKQFLRMIKNEDTKLESMIQRVWRQLHSAQLANSTHIVTNKAQVDMIQNQIGTGIPLIVEPERRDTFPAIALAASYLYSFAEASLDEIVCVLPVDAYVENCFFERMKKIEETILESGATLALIGAYPSYPSEKYGYIVPRHPTSNEHRMPYMTVQKFIEKPHKEEAQKLIEQKALWNCGVFAFTLDYLLGLLSDSGLPLQYEELVKRYAELPATSFDYEVVEKAGHIVVIPYEGEWRDLGTWNTLTEKMDTHVIGKGVVSIDSSNTHLINELEIPVAILGLSNIVVVSSPDGILVSDKSASPRIKEIMQNMRQRPMYEERRWGWYRVLDYQKSEDGKEVLTKRLNILAGKNLSYQMHLKRTEVWTIISGEGEFILNGKWSRIKQGDVLQIPIGARHAAKATSDLELIEVQIGNELIEEDIVRFCMIWEEMEKGV